MYTITKNGEPVSPTKEVLAEIARQVEEENDGYPKYNAIIHYPRFDFGTTASNLVSGYKSNYFHIQYDLGFYCDTKEQAQKRLDQDIALAKVLHYIRVNDLAVSDEDLETNCKREYILYRSDYDRFDILRYNFTVLPTKLPALKEDCADTIIKKFGPELRIIFGV